MKQLGPVRGRTAAASLQASLTKRLREAGCVFAEDEARLLVAEAPSAERLEAMVRQRVEGLPLEHVLGWADFCGLRVAVDAGVFVPRRRTEFLVRRAAGIARPGAVVVDLCCGSGAVGAALAKAAPGIQLHAADVDAAAVECARRNLAGVGGLVHEGDLYSALPPELRGRVELIVANAPYVPTKAIDMMPPEARLHEPRMSLDGGPDGLDLQRRIAAGAAEWLVPGGSLLIETSAKQAARTTAIFGGYGMAPSVAASEDLNATVVLGVTARTAQAAS